jgi:hypothetical protein
MKDSLQGVDWQQATTKVHSFNTIATLVYHIHYFVIVAGRVLEGGPLEGNDKYSFDHPPIHSQEDWEQFLDKVWDSASHFADLVERLPDDKLWETFSNEKYGTYYRNIQGIIEHSHYHLGQITLIKKLVQGS